MDFIQKQPGLSVLVAFVVGLIIGLPILGWSVWPVEWTDATPQSLAQEDQDKLLRTVAELYSLDGNNADKARNTLSAWPSADAAASICDLGSRSLDPAEQVRLDAIARVVNNGVGCDGTAVDGSATVEPIADESSSSIIPVLSMGVLFLLFIAGIFYVIQRRNALMEDVDMGSGIEIPDSAPISGGDDEGDAVAATPLARFQSTYTYGRDTYDDSFSIEGENGDFLGECGIGISESIGTDTPKNVTAFEVWLFDKNDIRTVTKVMMSDHAFFDEAMKAKLAPKGEPVLARENEVIVLETATLIINAEIKSMAYGSGTLPPQSFMENFTVELSAWSKDGDFDEPDVQGRVDEILDY